MAEAAMTAEEAVKILKEGIEAADKALDLWNKYLDTIIPWKEFDKTCKELDKYRQDYSNEAGILVGKVKTLLNNAMDAYFLSTQAIYEWCDFASDLLETFVETLKGDDKVSAAEQKEDLVAVLAKGVTQMNAAQVHLGTSLSTFNDAIGELSSLQTRLKNDFDKNSEYFNSQVAKCRAQAYGPAAIGIIAGPFGLVISYSIAAGITEGEIIPRLHEKFDEIKKFYDNTKGEIEKANTNIETTKTELKNEIRMVGELKNKTEKVQHYLPKSHTTILIKKSDDLIVACQAFMKRHRKEE